MVASSVVSEESTKVKRKRKNSQAADQGKKFNRKYDGLTQTSNLTNIKTKIICDNNPCFKDKKRDSYQTEPDDGKDDLSSLEDYAGCSETEMEIQKLKGVSISDAISAIMSEGGALNSSGALQRQSFKKKTKNKKNKKMKKVTGASEGTDANNLSSMTINSKNVQWNYDSSNNKDEPSVTKNHTTFPDNLSNFQSTKKNNLSMRAKNSDNALSSPQSQTGSKFGNGEGIETVLNSKHVESAISPKKKNKLKMSDQSTCASTQVQEGDEGALNSSVSENIIDMNAIHPKYTDKSFRKMLKAAWSGSGVPAHELLSGAQVLQQPFNCARLPHFLDSSDNLLGRLQEELSQLSMSEKNNDMYKFHQSVELPRSGACLELRELLEGPVRRWLRKATGITLNDKVALSASLYLHSDVLLCHDDELEGRRVAFILYLTGGEGDGDSSWGPQDGGSLDLFSCDESGRPDRVVNRLYPAQNTFAFFEVSPASFHQVSEVLSPHKVRLSVNGWFHGPDIERPPRPPPAYRHFLSPGEVELEDIYSWISPLFRTESLQATVRKQFARDSQIYLEDFVPEEKYAELCQALREVPLDSWRWTGPPNRAHYQVAPNLDTQPDAVQRLLRVLQSEAGLLVMAQLTGLPLHPLAPSDGSDDDTDRENGSDEDGSESEPGDGEDSDGSAADQRINKSRTKSKGSCDEGSGGDEEVEEEKLETLKKILKTHKKMSKSLLKSSNFVQEEPPKKKRKKSKSAALEAGLDVCGMDQPWIADVGLGNGRKGADRSGCSSSLGRVYSSVRRISHGCYSLILDDDNDGDKQLIEGSSGGSTDTDPALGGRKNKAGKSKSSSSEDAEKNLDASSDNSVKVKNKKLCGKMDGSFTAKKTLGEGCGNETSSKKGGSSSEGDKFVLDLVYFVDVPEDWQESWGGYTAYVAKGEQEELLTVTPRPNTLALVYRDADTFNFLKHVNCLAATKEAGGKPRHYHALVCQYK